MTKQTEPIARARQAKRTRSAAPASPSTPSEPIAVVGLASRLPQAPNPTAFWSLLTTGRSAVGDVPPERWKHDALFDGHPPAAVAGAFLDGVAGIDAAFFGLSPHKATAMDPQQRLVLELAREALEDAGTVPSAIPDSRAGVFIGAIMSDYVELLARGGAAAIGRHSITGAHRSIIANRVSYILGLQGPSLTLVAVHLACESPRSGESSLASTGGVNLNLIPERASPPPASAACPRTVAASPSAKTRTAMFAAKAVEWWF